MVNDVLLYVGSGIIILWGIAHLIPTRAIADGFGEISGDNRRVLVMEVIAEGLTLIFIGVLVILVTYLAGSGSYTADIVYITCSVMLIFMALVTQMTGARTLVMWYKICPYVKTIVAILFLISLSGPPESGAVADYITVGFEDGSTIELSRNTPEFKEMSEEAIRVYQYVGLATECYFGSEEIEKIKHDCKFVEIAFEEPVKIPSSLLVKESDKENITTTEDGYRIRELKSALFPFTGEYDGHVLYKPDERYPAWYCFKGARSFSRLERMVNNLDR